MDLEDVMYEYRQFIKGRDSVTSFACHGEAERVAMSYKQVTDYYPLAPHPGYEEFCLPAYLCTPWLGAFRDPIMLLRVWRRAAYIAGRVDDPDPTAGRVLVRADGIQDKPHTFHVGLVLADDVNRMSAYSQRDFITACFSEKSQFHMMWCASQIGILSGYVRGRGGDLVLNADMVALKNLSRGLMFNPGGFSIKDFNASVCISLIVAPVAVGAGLAPAGSRLAQHVSAGWPCVFSYVLSPYCRNGLVHLASGLHKGFSGSGMPQATSQCLGRGGCRVPGRGRHICPPDQQGAVHRPSEQEHGRIPSDRH